MLARDKNRPFHRKKRVDVPACSYRKRGSGILKWDPSNLPPKSCVLKHRQLVGPGLHPLEPYLLQPQHKRIPAG